MKLRFTFLFIVIYCISYAQNKAYTDSLQNAIANQPKKVQLKKIVEIPYAKFVSDITNSEKLIIKGKYLAIELKDGIAVQTAIQHCLANGLITDWFLFNSSALRISPPLTITAEQLLWACETLCKHIDLL